MVERACFRSERKNRGECRGSLKPLPLAERDVMVVLSLSREECGYRYSASLEWARVSGSWNYFHGLSLDLIEKKREKKCEDKLLQNLPIFCYFLSPTCLPMVDQFYSK